MSREILDKLEADTLRDMVIDLWAVATKREAKITQLRVALKPFANYACDPPCLCHNCIAKSALED